MRLSVAVAVTVLLVIACGFNPALFPPAGVALILGLLLWALWRQLPRFWRTARVSGWGRPLALTVGGVLLATAIGTDVSAFYGADPTGALVASVVALAVVLATRALLYGSRPPSHPIRWRLALGLTLVADAGLLLALWEWLDARGLPPQPVPAPVVLACLAFGTGLCLLALSSAPVAASASAVAAAAGRAPARPGEAVVRARRVVAVLVMLFGVLALGLPVFVMFGAGAPPALILSPRYDGTASYDGTRWEVTDRIVFDSASGIAELRRTPAAGPRGATDPLDQLTQRLEGQGWRVSSLGSELVFTKERRQVAKVRWYPPTTNSQLPITLPGSIGILTKPGFRLVRFAPRDEDSRLTLTTRPHLIAATIPPAPPEIAGGREVRRLKLLVAAGEQVQVDLQMVSPLFRNALGVALARVTFGGAAKWLVLGVAALFSQEIKQAIVVPLIGRLLRRVPVQRRPRTAPASQGPTPATPDAGAEDAPRSPHVPL